MGWMDLVLIFIHFYADSHDNETYRKMKIVEFKLMDSNGDRLVDFDEFVDFRAQKVGMNKVERDWLAQSESTHLAFERADRNGDGKIEMNEIVEDEKTPNSSELINFLEYVTKNFSGMKTKKNTIFRNVNTKKLKLTGMKNK